jgi:hypothetical protein
MPPTAKKRATAFYFQTVCTAEFCLVFGLRIGTKGVKIRSLYRAVDINSYKKRQMIKERFVHGYKVE